ncbi:MAG TPA: zinc-binding dehydrogenase [Methanospirillum sp.]|uniref:zinc-binding dehydrogenase n=1 Tax=Methanospirillum sp. TaxID=45200 RepID=UPI002B5FEA3D|nr:zinc-binding dehydrogenase [Methanospirillum sp.]HWQ63562.1 zinc-binding dehydrogenase [Methanospirillum sp.]
MNKTKAAILVETKTPLRIVDLHMPLVRKGQVLIKIKYSGICHTQLSECQGVRGKDTFLPHCLGHEGSGVVVDVGEGITKLKLGDHVILSWIRGSGMNGGPGKYQWGDQLVNAGPITTFSQYALISEDRVTSIPKNFSLLYAALIGCAIPTGYGAVVNVAQPKPGMSMGIYGCGGIGLCALKAAKISGCTPIVAIDTNEGKLAAAKELGATHIINPGDRAPLTEIFKICPQGLDFCIEATGVPSVMEQVLPSVRNQGGVATIIGNAHFGDRITVDPHEFNQGKQLRGTWGGDIVPDRDFPRIIHLIDAGIFNPDFLISRIYSLNQINEALDDLATGRVIRPIIDMER